MCASGLSALPKSNLILSSFVIRLYSTMYGRVTPEMDELPPIIYRLSPTTCPVEKFLANVGLLSFTTGLILVNSKLSKDSLIVELA